MKRLLILFIIAALAGGTTRTFAYNTASAKDSLLQVLDTLPVGESRFATLYSLAYLDPMSPSCVYYLGKLLDEPPNMATNTINVSPYMLMSFIITTTKMKKIQQAGWTSLLKQL